MIISLPTDKWHIEMINFLLHGFDLIFGMQ